MNLDIVNNQNIAQFISILSNPEFINAVKSATKSTSSDNSSSLLDNLDKLRSILESSNSDSNVTNTSSGESLSLLKSTASKSSSSTDLSVLSNAGGLDSQIDSLINNADLLESLLNTDIVPPSDELADLFAKFREIITKLDADTRKLQQEVKSKEVKTTLKLEPSSTTKSGFQEAITLVAQ